MSCQNVVSYNHVTTDRVVSYDSVTNTRVVNYNPVTANRVSSYNLVATTRVISYDPVMTTRVISCDLVTTLTDGSKLRSPFFHGLQEVAVWHHHLQPTSVGRTKKLLTLHNVLIEVVDCHF